jgi:hypothetical protein
MRDFFISYNSADKTWAEWIAWVLEEYGYTVIIQAWDFRPGGNFILDMQRATAEAQRTIMVLSEAYLNALYTQPEWAAAFKQDPTSRERKLLPIRVAPCQPTGMLAPLVYVDLVGKSETEAEILLLAALQDRGKPTSRPRFPQSSSPADRVTPPTVAFPTPPPTNPPPTTHNLQTVSGGTATQINDPTAPVFAGPISGGNINITYYPATPPAQTPQNPPKASSSSTITQRLALIQKLTGLPSPQFEQILFALDPPAGNVPSAQAPQADRVKALLDWATSIGPGLEVVEAVYSQVVSLR